MQVGVVRNRILVNFSGEFFPNLLEFVVSVIVAGRVCGKEVVVVCGGGNVLRGGRGSAKSIDRAVADQIGMLGTVINSLFLYDALRVKTPTRMVSALQVQHIACYNPITASQEVTNQVLIIGGGTGVGGISTDTASILYAQQLKCDLWIKVTKYDEVYDSDPATNPSAQVISNPTYKEISRHNLMVIDPTAAALGAEHGPGMLLINGHNTNAEDFWRQVATRTPIE